MLTLFFTCVLTVLPDSQSTLSSTIDTYAGNGHKGYTGDGHSALQARLDSPFDVALDSEGNLYFSDTFNHCIRRVDVKTKQITTVAGSGKKGHSGNMGPATRSLLNEPYGVTVDSSGTLYFVDRLNYCVHQVDGTTGIITRIAGNGTSGFSGDGGPGAKAQLREPNGLALDHKGHLYIADVSDQRIRVLDLKTGIIDTFCGNGRKEQTGDGGPYQEASLMGPRAVAVGPNGHVYICEREGNAIRSINLKTGKITRFAGNGKRGYSGDGGPASKATFNGPKEVDIDSSGNLFIVDTENHAIRRIDFVTRTVTTITGTGTPGGTGDRGPATEGTLDRPHGVVVSPDGRVYIGDTVNHRIRIVN